MTNIVYHILSGIVVPYSICAEIQETGNIWADKSGHRKNTATVM